MMNMLFSGIKMRSLEVDDYYSSFRVVARDLV